jgi:hypothetical protein
MPPPRPGRCWPLWSKPVAELPDSVQPRTVNVPTLRDPKKTR